MFEAKALEKGGHFLRHLSRWFSVGELHTKLTGTVLPVIDAERLIWSDMKVLDYTGYDWATHGGVWLDVPEDKEWKIEFIWIGAFTGPAIQLAFSYAGRSTVTLYFTPAGTGEVGYELTGSDFRLQGGCQMALVGIQAGDNNNTLVCGYREREYS